MLVDDHVVYRERLRALLDTEPGMTVVAEAADGRAAVELARVSCPDVVVMDLALPGLSGLDAMRLILSDDATVAVIVVSLHADRRIVNEVFSAGGRGFVPKDARPDELLRVIRAVAGGETELGRHHHTSERDDPTS